MRLNEFLEQFGMSAPSSARLIDRSYFDDPDPRWLKNHPVYVGKCLGHLRGDEVIPSVGLLQLMGKQAQKRISVNDRGEWLLICGRDLFAETITSHKGVNKGDIAVILNKNDECIGYGKVVAPFDTKKVVVKRMFDLGDIMRRELKRGKRRR